MCHNMPKETGLNDTKSCEILKMKRQKIIEKIILALNSALAT